MEFERGLNLEATKLRLGLPGTTDQDSDIKINTTNNNKRKLNLDFDEPEKFTKKYEPETTTPVVKAQVVGWPPIRSYRKNCLEAKKTEEESTGIYVKVSMDGAPYLRKIDLKLYKNYNELLQALEDMFKFNLGKYCESEGYSGSEFVPTYEDKDGDWMLLGDVPWNMFINSCKKLRIMKGSEARGLMN